MRGWKAISFNQFLEIMQCRKSTLFLGNKIEFCNKIDKLTFCLGSDCPLWRKLGSAGIKVSKIIANNNKSIQCQHDNRHVVPHGDVYECDDCGERFL